MFFIVYPKFPQTGDSRKHKRYIKRGKNHDSTTLSTYSLLLEAEQYIVHQKTIGKHNSHWKRVRRQVFTHDLAATKEKE